MARPLDTPLRKVAQTVLHTFGTTVIFTHSTPGSYDPATGIAANPSTTSVSVKGRIDDYRARELNDTIRATDRKLTIAAADLASVPDVDDTVTVAGSVYDIVRIDPVMATDLDALYVIQLRR